MGFGWVYEVGLLVWLVAVEGGWGVGVLRAVSVGVSGRYGGVAVVVVCSVGA